MAGKRPVGVGDVYQMAVNRFEITAFDTVKPRGPWAIGVETGRMGLSWETLYKVAHLVEPYARLISGGEGQAIEVDHG